MSGGREYRIGITADDSGVAPGIDKLSKALRKFEEGPVRRLNTNLDEATRRSRLDQFEKGWSKVGKEVRGVGDEIFNMLPGLSVLTRVGSAAGAALAAGAVSYGFAQQGRTLQQTSALLGISIDRLQTLIGAAAQKGIDQDTFLGSLTSLQQSLDQARLGRNPELLNILNVLRLRLPAPDQPLDLATRLEEIADAIARQPLGERKVEVATMLQSLPLFQLLREGAPGLRQLEESVPRISRMSEEASKKGDALAASIDRLGIAASGAANKIGEKLNVKGGVDWLTDFLNLWSMMPSPGEKWAMAGRAWREGSSSPAPSAAAPTGPTAGGGVPWYKQKPLSQMTPDELARVGRQNQVAVSGPDGRVIIQLKVDSAPGLRVRAIAQDQGPVQTEIFMPTDGP